MNGDDFFRLLRANQQSFVKQPRRISKCHFTRLPLIERHTICLLASSFLSVVGGGMIEKDTLHGKGDCIKGVLVVRPSASGWIFFEELCGHLVCPSSGG